MQQPNESAGRLFQSPAEFPIAENGDWAGLWKEPKHRGGQPLHPGQTANGDAGYASADLLSAI